MYRTQLAMAASFIVSADVSCLPIEISMYQTLILSGSVGTRERGEWGQGRGESGDEENDGEGRGESGRGGDERG